MTGRTAWLAVVLLAAAVPGGPVLAQSAGSEELARRISVKFDGVDLATALTRLRTVFRVPLAFSTEAIPDHRSVNLTAIQEPVADVLTEMLLGTGLQVIPLEGGALVIARRSEVATSPSTRSPSPGIATGIRELDQIVVMGTPVSGAPEKEQTSAVTVVSGKQLAEYHFTRTADLFRTALPGVVLWDQGPSGPPAEVAAVRGASSFTARGLKTYIDGIEVASPTLVTLIDPRSIERIEVIRGPQGAALYGSDAINGVIHVVTRKGNFGESPRMQAAASIAAGPFNRGEISTLLRQDYAGGLSWGGARSSLAASGSMGRLGTTETAPNTRSWNAQTGGQIALGSVLLSAIGRGGQFDFTEDPFRAASGAASPAPAKVELATVGATAVHQVRNWWVQTFVAGYDRAAGALGSQRTYLGRSRQPLSATHETAKKSSLRYSSSFTANTPSGIALTATLGAEYSHLERSRGSWNTDISTRYVNLYDEVVDNAGTFLQGKLRSGAFVINAGARAERSSAFGTDYGTAWAPSLGMSWSKPIGEFALRLRGGWGRGIRPPEPGMSRGMATATVQQVTNPGLAPEAQAGLEVGADLYAGTTGYVRATYFSQRATDLIQSVLMAGPAGSLRTYQFQNVGAIRNRGVELEGGVRFERVGIDAQFYSTTSRVDQIARTYSGWLRPGDPLPEIPSFSGAARITYSLPGLQMAAGSSFLGSWTGYDWNEIARVDAGLAPARPSTRDYLISYPGLFRPYFSLSVEVARQFRPYLVIDNLANQADFVQHNGNPPAGRSVLFGVEIRP